MFLLQFTLITGRVHIQKNMGPYLQGADDLLHLCPAEIQEAFNEVPVNESCGLLRLSLRVEGPPGSVESRNINTRPPLRLRTTPQLQ